MQRLGVQITRAELENLRDRAMVLLKTTPRKYLSSAERKGLRELMKAAGTMADQFRQDQVLDVEATHDEVMSVFG